MSDYISREAALTELQNPELFNVSPRFLQILRDLPAADVEPVRHGRWVRPHWRNSSYCCDCSECGGEAMHREYQWNKKGIYPICPNCGAKMDLEDETNDD